MKKNDLKIENCLYIFALVSEGIQRARCITGEEVALAVKKKKGLPKSTIQKFNRFCKFRL